LPPFPCAFVVHGKSSPHLHALISTEEIKVGMILEKDVKTATARS